MIGSSLTVFAALLAASSPVLSAGDAARAFGARVAMRSAELSPDGRRIVYIAPGTGQQTVATIIDLHTGAVTPTQQADGRAMTLAGCGWSANDRVVCTLAGQNRLEGQFVRFSRLVAFDADGSHAIALGRRQSDIALRMSQFDGRIIDWLSGEDGSVLMTRDYVPEVTTGTRLATTKDGYAVERVNTRTGAATRIEAPNRSVSGYLSDGRGQVRIMAASRTLSASEQLSGITVYVYRQAGKRDWLPFSKVGMHGGGMVPIAVDGTADVAYALSKEGGRDALYRVALDGSLKAEKVYADPTVDVDGVVQVGRAGRVIGATYATDKRNTVYFDPAYAKLATALGRAIPKLPLIRFESASADENILLLHAGSDVDAGRYYVYDRTTRKLEEVLASRPQLDGQAMGAMRAITYPAADGTPIPAYLTLPAGSDGKGLPAIVLPHGGPSSRDEWGFDWLAQYFANRGYAVLQPNYRGSAGYGADWAQTNAFRSWRLAIGDVVDAGRWLVSSGISTPDRLGIFGWSYGGYAALQANVLAPDLFKAVVAVAPVTDFGMVKMEAQGYTNAALVAEEVGSGAIVSEGSPARHADAFRAPVLMFHGTEDSNVGVGQARAMDAALRRAGKSSQLVIYPGLDHQLEDADARADMLAKSDAFLRREMKR